MLQASKHLEQPEENNVNSFLTTMCMKHVGQHMTEDTTHVSCRQLGSNLIFMVCHCQEKRTTSETFP